LEKVTDTARLDVEMRSKAQGRIDPSRYEAAVEMAVCDNQHIACVQSFFTVLPVIFANLRTHGIKSRYQHAVGTVSPSK
jgi:hypothetical protein